MMIASGRRESNVATALVAAYGTWWPLACYAIFLAACAVVAIWIGPETYRRISRPMPPRPMICPPQCRRAPDRRRQLRSRGAAAKDDLGRSSESARLGAARAV
jgi:hypothetical protein